MRTKTSKAIYAYWNAIRGGRVAPQRFEIEPAQLSTILPETFILEKLSFESYRFRLAGTRICERFGQELRGVDFLDLWSPEHRQEIVDKLAVITENGAIGRCDVTGVLAGGDTIWLEFTLLPLQHADSQINRVLGTVSLYRPAQWGDDEPVLRPELIKSDLLWPADLGPSVVEPAATAVSKQEPFHAHVRSARIVQQDRRRFRVYEGGLSKDAPDKV